jgi:formate/nitrite transporter
VSFKDPQEITEAGIKTGATKARLSWDKVLVASFLAGAYIAFGGLLAITVTSGMREEIWGSLPTMFAGAVFALGLILVVIAGSELLTGNMALVPLAAFSRRVRIRQLFGNLGLVLIGNLLGALFVAYFLAVESGVVTQELQIARLEEIATLKGVEETPWEIFLRAVGCNWLVCLAVWLALAATDVTGKILGIFFPIMAFVAMGFDHVVANMFFLPAAIFAGAGDVTWGDTLNNWLWAGLGNFVGAAIFVAGAYWYLYAKPDDEVDEPGGIREDVDAARAGGNGARETAGAAGASSQPTG